jgi:hypothetical protein
VEESAFSRLFQLWRNLMKRLLSTLALSLAAALCLAGDESADTTTESTAPAAMAAVEGEVVPATAPAPVIPKSKEGAEVIAKSPAGLTVKLDGQEKTLPIRGKASAALKVVTPGDKVRLFYVEENPEGEPVALTGFTITDPARVDMTKKDGKSETKDRAVEK